MGVVAILGVVSRNTYVLEQSSNSKVLQEIKMKLLVLLGFVLIHQTAATCDEEPASQGLDSFERFTQAIYNSECIRFSMPGDSFIGSDGFFFPLKN